jgi:hypothetical protein
MPVQKVQNLRTAENFFETKQHFLESGSSGHILMED